MTSTFISKLDIEDCLKNIDSWSRPRPAETLMLVGPAQSYIVPEPHGVALVISSWNYPLLLSISPVSQAIAAGNCVMLKPSELAPNT